MPDHRRTNIAENRNFRGLLVLIVAINIVNGALLAIIVPMWTGPDELAHYGHIQHLRLHGSLPDQRTCYVSEEVKGSTYDADWWGLKRRTEKVEPGAEAFYTHGFAAFGEAGSCQRTNAAAHIGESSLALNYNFTPQEEEALCAYKPGVDVLESDGLGLWVRGDSSNVLLQLSVETVGRREHYLKVPVDWRGWKRIVAPFSLFSSDLVNDRCRSAVLKIYVADDDVSQKTLSGTILIDDIWLTRQGQAIPVTGFEDDELPLMVSDCFNWCAHHPPLYYLLMLPIDVALSKKPIFTRVLAIRLFSMLLSTITIAIAALAGKLIFGTRSLTWLLVPALFLFSPVFTFDQACINNDHLLILLYSLLLYLMLKWSESPLDRKKVLALGAVVGLGLMSKLLFITAIPIVFLFVWQNERRNGLDGLKRASSKWGLFMLVVLGISGWWFVRNCVLYEMPIITATMFRPDEKLPVVIGLIDILRSTSLWAWVTTGWFFRIASHTGFSPSQTSYQLTYLLFDITALGLVRAAFLKIFMRRRLLTPQTARRLRILAYSVVIHTLIIFTQVAKGTMSVGTFRAFSGRYILPVAIGMGAYFAFGIENLLPQKIRRFGVLVVVVILIVIEVLTVHITMMKVCYPF